MLLTVSGLGTCDHRTKRDRENQRWQENALIDYLDLYILVVYSAGEVGLTNKDQKKTIAVFLSLLLISTLFFHHDRQRDCFYSAKQQLKHQPASHNGINNDVRQRILEECGRCTLSMCTTTDWYFVWQFVGFQCIVTLWSYQSYTRLVVHGNRDFHWHRILWTSFVRFSQHSYYLCIVGLFCDSLLFGLILYCTCGYVIWNRYGLYCGIYRSICGHQCLVHFWDIVVYFHTHLSYLNGFFVSVHCYLSKNMSCIMKYMLDV